MQCTSNVKLAPGVSVDDLRTHLKQQYANEYFVKVGTLQVITAVQNQLSRCPVVETASSTACTWSSPLSPIAALTVSVFECHLAQVLDKGVVPHTRHVRGSNFAMMNVFEVREYPWPEHHDVICPP